MNYYLGIVTNKDATEFSPIPDYRKWDNYESARIHADYLGRYFFFGCVVLQDGVPDPREIERGAFFEEESV